MKQLTRSFSSALVQNAAGLVLVIGSAVLIGMVWQAVSSTRQAAEYELSHALDRSVERLRILIQAAEMTADSAERIARVPAVTASTLFPALDRALAAFEQRPELSYLGIVLPEYGEYGTLERTSEGQILLWLHPGARPDAAMTRNFVLTEQGFIPYTQQAPNGYDPRARPFYQAALQGAAEGRWLPSYQWIVHSISRVPLWGLSYVKALWDANAQLIGVLDVDLDLPALNRFLQELATEYGVQLQIVELGNTPLLIGDQRIAGEPLSVPNELAQLIQSQGEAGVGQWVSAQGSHWAAVRHLELKGGLTWVVVASRPTALIEAPLRRQLYQVAGMGLLILIGLVWGSIRIARRFTQPLVKLERRLKQASDSDTLEPLVIDSPSSEFRETQRLEQALSHLALAVQQREEQLALQNIELLEAKEQQLASLALKGAIIDSTDTAIFSLDKQLLVIEWNRAATQLFGCCREQVLQRPITELVDTPENALDWPSMLAIKDISTYQLVGHLGVFDAEVRVIKGHQQGQPVYTLVIEDISARRKAERRLKQERDYADAVLNSLPGVFYHCDEYVRLQRWNRNFERITGTKADQLLGVDPISFMPKDEQERVAAKVAEVFEKGAVHFEASYVLPNGQRIPCLFTGVRFAHEGACGFVGLGTDISERKRAEQRLRHLATHDVVTDLPNRYLLRDRLEQAIASAEQTHKPQALLLVDLNRFKVVNDAYGHPFGDKVLKAMGERLVSLFTQADTVARHSGDQFLILVRDLRHVDEAHLIARKVIDSICQPILLQGREIHLSSHVGLSLCPYDSNNAETLIQHADQALCHAKRLGRNRCVSFTAEMNQQMQQRINLETFLHGAVAAGQLQLVYQPKVSLHTGGIVGCEALLRWHHPQLGMIPPDQFIPVAEESGLIVPISAWVMRTACLQAKAWFDAGLPRTTVAVNISAYLLQQDLSVWTLDVLQETGLAPELLELELTESMIAQDVERTIGIFDRLTAVGIRLSIDDFGTGYSSLSYLKHLPVDTLKIDKSFVDNMLIRSEDEAIVRSVIRLAHSLKFKVVAEGVETAEQCDVLRAYRCDEIQGYYFSKPVSAQAFETLLREGTRLEISDTTMLPKISSS